MNFNQAQLQKMARARLGIPGYKDGFRGSLYDFQTYSHLGHQALTFFQVPIGGTLAGASRTLDDTNMDLAGTLPQGAKFIVDSIEIFFWPGSSAAGYVAQAPVKTATAVAAPNYANDLAAFYASGHVRMMVGKKEVVQEAPIGRFPPTVGLDLDAVAAAVTTTAATTYQVTVDYARAHGQSYKLPIPIPLESQFAFSVSLGWGAALAMPSGFDARVGVVLNGVTIRNG